MPDNTAADSYTSVTRKHPVVEAAEQAIDAIYALGRELDATPSTVTDPKLRAFVTAQLQQGCPLSNEDIDSLPGELADWATRVSEVLNALHQEVPPLVQAEAAGWQAYVEGRPAAPAADPVVMKLLEGTAVGDGAVEIMRAFTRGRDAAADAAAAAVLAEADNASPRTPCSCCGRRVAPLDQQQRCGHCGANRATTHRDDQPCRIAR